MTGIRRLIGVGLVTCLSVAGLLSVPPAPAALADGGPVGEMVTIAKWYDNIPEGIKYRIPALTQTPNGDLLAVYDMRPNQDALASNIGVVKRTASQTAPAIADSIVEGAAVPSYEIPDNGIGYELDGKLVEPGVYRAQPGERIDLKLHGLAEHGYTLPADTPVAWTHTFLKVTAGPIVVHAGEVIAATPVDVVGNGGALSFELGDGAPAWLELSDDGVLTGTAPADAPEGTVTFPVLVTEQVDAEHAAIPASIPGTYTAQAMVTLTVVPAGVNPDDLPQLSVVLAGNPYDATVGEPATSLAPDAVDATGMPVAWPEGTTFALADGAPEGATIDSVGAVTFTPGEADTGEDVDITVNITYPPLTAHADSEASFVLTFRVAEGESGPDQPGVTCQPENFTGRAPYATNRFGEATGDRLADLWSLDAEGKIHFYENVGSAFVHKYVAHCPGAEVTAMTAIMDANGDRRADLLIRHADGDLYFYYSLGRGQLVQGIKAGHGWNGMDNITYMGRLGTKEYVVARQVATGDLYRYDLTRNGLANGTKIGHGWQEMTNIVGIGQFVGDSYPDVVATRSDGKLFVYAGTNRGVLVGKGQIGHGWSNFGMLSSPGDVDGGGTFDLIGIRNDGTLFLYKNLLGGRFGGATQIGHGWGSMKAAS
ncbi:Rib/alpha-like domain-containing protein [Trueperella bernardiae]|uniref:Rib/alpha-like domain-containing protein n=1 Tax=Trueperella bernardiae TaxID=59561 RepID=UPI0023F441CA|nr:Rib/alpha-like domain-containing protein [Trueperella bernardiae]